MPELAEVETVRREIEARCVGRRIASVWCAEDSIVFSDQTPKAVARHLKGRMLSGTGRKGKQFWITLDDGCALLLHLGMTGWVEFDYPADERPRFAKLEVVLEDGERFAYRDARRLGRIRMRKDVLHQPPVSALGFDPYLDDPGAVWFAAELRKRKAPIKAVLLDQTFSAGIGNWLADEICFQAKIDPRRRASALSLTEARAIYRVMKRIVHRAVELGADDTKFPKTWLFHHRWGKNAEARTSMGDQIEYCTVGGRTTAWVPTVQV